MVQGISVSASVFTLVAIAVDRYDGCTFILLQNLYSYSHRYQTCINCIEQVHIKVRVFISKSDCIVILPRRRQTVPRAIKVMGVTF